jgi:hypothetical protein
MNKVKGRNILLEKRNRNTRALLHSTLQIQPLHSHQKKAGRRQHRNLYTLQYYATSFAYNCLLFLKPTNIDLIKMNIHSSASSTQDRTKQPRKHVQHPTVHWCKKLKVQAVVCFHAYILKDYHKNTIISLVVTKH